jgi:hypothetical protein
MSTKKAQYGNVGSELGSPFHGGNRGSNPLGDASKIKGLRKRDPFSLIVADL